jgi:hypothetical protein
VSARLLLGDAFRLARQHFRKALLAGALLMLASKLIFISSRLFSIHVEAISYNAIEWPVYLVTAFLTAQFAFNVHRFVILERKSFLFATGKVFLLFFAAVVVIDLAFFIPKALLGDVIFWRIWDKSPYVLLGQQLQWRYAISMGIDVTALFLFAWVLVIPAYIVAQQKLGLRTSSAIGRKMHFQVAFGIVCLQLLLGVIVTGVTYVGWGISSAIVSPIPFDNIKLYSSVNIVVQNLLHAPISFFTVLLGATFTSAAYLRGIAAYRGAASEFTDGSQTTSLL